MLHTYRLYILGYIIIFVQDIYLFKLDFYLLFYDPKFSFLSDSNKLNSMLTLFLILRRKILICVILENPAGFNLVKNS